MMPNGGPGGRIATLEAALKDAIELAEEGWGYAGDYFNEKWDSKGRISALRDILGQGGQGGPL